MSLDPYGKWGNLARLRGSTQQDTSFLPDWMRSQYTDKVSVDEGGTQTHNYDFHDTPWGGFKGEDGQYYVQVGDPSSWKAGDQDGGIKDRSKVKYDPNAGWITTADNLHDSGIGGIDWRMVALAVGAGAAGTAMGVGAGAEGAAGTGALEGVGGEVGGEIVNTYAAGANPANYYETLGATTGGGGGAGSSLLDLATVDESAGLNMNPYSTPYDASGGEIVNTYTPGADPTQYYNPGGWEGYGQPGGEIVNEYTPGSDPSQYYEPLGAPGSSMWDRVLRAARALPGLANAVKPGAVPVGRGAGSSAGATVSGPGGRSAGGGIGSVHGSDAFRKGKLTDVGTLAQYLRGQS